MSDDWTGWDALFIDGPLADHWDRHFTGSLPDTLYYAPIRSTVHPWAWVGCTGLEPDVPWEGQVKYVAIDEIPERGGTVRFRLESER